MTAIVLLPGLDGTGILFHDFIAELKANSIVVSYPADHPLDYDALEALVTASLPRDEPYVLLGESFSGPIALSIAAKQPPNLCAVVLVASFARLPGLHLPAWVQRVISASPAWRMPLPITSRTVLGHRFYSRKLYAPLAQVHNLVAPEVWKLRLREVMAVDRTALLPRIRVPLLYLRAMHDKVVFASASQLISTHLPAAQVVDIDAPHFLLLVRPVEAAVAIKAFAAEHGIEL